jgi:hypothetical protein
MKIISKRLRIVLLVAIVTILFVPFIPVEIAPPLELIALEVDGRPIRNLTIEQVWCHYTYQFTESTDLSISGEDGVARFPRREGRFSLARIAFGKFVELVNFNPHASFGPSTYFLARGNVSGYVKFESGDALPLRMTVER